MKSGDRITPRISAKQQLQTIKDELFRAYRTHHRQNDHMLRLALNEAEALAWQTGYPHLVFPVLAAEKARAASVWQTRQHLVRTNEVSFAA